MNRKKKTINTKIAWRLIIGVTAYLCMSAVTQALPLTNNIIYWYKADSGITVGNGGEVTNWPDCSGYDHGGDIALTNNPNVTAKPTWQENVVNGKPVVRFANVDNGLGTYNLSVDPTDRSYTYFFVLKLDADAHADQVYNMILDQGVNGDQRIILRATDNAADSFVFYDGGYSTGLGVLPLNSFLVVSLVLDDYAGTGTLYTNGVYSGADDYAYKTLQGRVFVGGDYEGRHGIFGDIAEVLCYRAALSERSRSEVEEYLGSKYGISVAAGPPAPVLSDLPRTSDIIYRYRADQGIDDLSGQVVTNWSDSSGYNHGADITLLNQSATADGPRFRVDWRNGYGAVHFDGVEDNLGWNQAGVGDTSISSYTFFMVMDYETAVDPRAFLIDQGLGASRIILGTRFNTQSPPDQFFYYDGAAYRFSGVAPLGPQVVSLVLNAGEATGTLYTNGVEVADMTYSPQTWGDRMYLSGDSAKGNYEYKGWVAEVICYKDALGVSDRENVQNHLGAKYGIDVYCPPSGTIIFIK